MNESYDIWKSRDTYELVMSRMNLVQVAGEAVYLEFCGICKDLYTK